MPAAGRGARRRGPGRTGDLVSRVENGGPGGVTNLWYRLTPSSTGSYLNGTWSQLASMNYQRYDYAAEVLPSGQVMIQGGEVSNDYQYIPPQGGNPGDDTPSGEVYNPFTNTWTNIATFAPTGTDGYDNFGDDPTETYNMARPRLSRLARFGRIDRRIRRHVRCRGACGAAAHAASSLIA